MASTASLAAAALRYGKLWGRGHETFGPTARRILSVKGSSDHATKYLQGLVTCDLKSEPKAPRSSVHRMKSDSPCDGRSVDDGTSTNTLNTDEEKKESTTELNGPPPVDVKFTSNMRSACFLDARGRILTDAILWKRPFVDLETNDNNQEKREEGKKDDEEEEYLIDVPGDTADLLLGHLKKYKLRRSKVKINDLSDEISVHCVYGSLNAESTPPGFMAAIDPRHPSLGMRILSTAESSLSPSTSMDTHKQRTQAFAEMMHNFFPSSNGTYSVIRKLAGVAEGSELSGKTALECNQEFLNAVSFQKGCYLGQELTARSQFTGKVRKRVMPIMILDTNTEVPRPWVLAHMIQELGADALKKSEDLSPGIGVDLGGEEGLPPPLPKVSCSGVGSIVSMLQGNLAKTTVMQGGSSQTEAIEEELTAEDEEALKKMQDVSEALMKDLSSVAVKGAQIVDKKDGKRIGQVLSTPASGTPVILTQMRLDRVGLLDSKENWSRTNRIFIGDSKKEFRYLPFLPIWWPEIDPNSGKELLKE